MIDCRCTFVCFIHLSAFNRLTFTRFNSSHKASEILLYDNPSRPKFVLLISMAAGIQFVFWGYLSYSALSDYYSATVKGKENLHDPQSLAEKDKVMMEHLETLQSKSSLKWRVTFSLLALSMGAFFGLTALMYPRRMVNRLTFNSKNNMLTISTSTPTGGLRHSEVHRMIIIINKIINILV